MPTRKPLKKARAVCVVLCVLLGAAVSLQAFSADPPPAKQGPNCGACAEKLKILSEQETAKQKNTELLGKNREYLAAISAKQASKILKVESNTIMILKKLDGIKATIEKLEDEYLQEGCRECAQTK